MSLLSVLIAAAEEEEHIDRTHHWLWPEGYELCFGGAAAITIFGLLFWKVTPFAKKALADRTARIQAQLDEAAEAMTSADRAAAEIRQAKGDIEAERARLLAEADEQAAALLAEGRARLDREVGRARGQGRRPTSPPRRRATSTSCAPRSRALPPRCPTGSSPRPSTTRPSSA